MQIDEYTLYEAGNDISHACIADALFVFRGLNSANHFTPGLQDLLVIENFENGDFGIDIEQGFIYDMRYGASGEVFHEDMSQLVSDPVAGSGNHAL